LSRNALELKLKQRQQQQSRGLLMVDCVKTAAAVNGRCQPLEEPAAVLPSTQHTPLYLQLPNLKYNDVHRI
jgi:hypothetical protein